MSGRAIPAPAREPLQGGRGGSADTTVCTRSVRLGEQV